MVDVRLDTLPQDLPWSKIGRRLVCKECGVEGSVNIVPNYPPDPRQMHSTNWNGWD
jgi:hypothetical protein